MLFAELADSSWSSPEPPGLSTLLLRPVPDLHGARDFPPRQDTTYKPDLRWVKSMLCFTNWEVGNCQMEVEKEKSTDFRVFSSRGVFKTST